MSTDQAIEQQIQERAAKAPRVTPQDVESAILSAHYLTVGSALAALGVCKSYETHVSLNLLTICVLVLRNGFTVTGESACASPENFDAEIGRTIARKAAVDKIWPLLGFRLRDQLCAEAHAASPIEGQEPGSIV